MIPPIVIQAEEVVINEMRPLLIKWMHLEETPDQEQEAA